MAMYDPNRKIYHGGPSTGVMPPAPGGIPNLGGQMMDWRSQRPQFDPATMQRPDFRQSMMDWRDMRPEKLHGPGMQPGVPPIAGAQTFPGAVNQRDFGSGLMSSIAKYMPPGWSY